MDRKTIITLVINTMTYYGSNAGEKAKPGSKLQSQAEHIADVIEQYRIACERTDDLEYIQVVARII